MSEKLCRGCGEIKALSEFSTDRSKPDGKHSRCKSCKHTNERPSRARVHVEIEMSASERADEEITAWDQAVQRLIDLFPSKFKQLLFSERVSRGLRDPLPYRIEGDFRGYVGYDNPE